MLSALQTTEKLYEVYAEVNESLDGAMSSLDEIQSDLEEEISCLSAALDEIRDEIESCRKAFQQLTRRMPSETLYSHNAQTDVSQQPDNGLPFVAPTKMTHVSAICPCIARPMRQHE